jgi:predicted alpha/beta superfamily hydrolase
VLLPKIRARYTRDTTEIVVGETVTIASEVLGEDRRVRVHLPEGYGDGEDRYPTLFVLDGRDHFLQGILRRLGVVL